MKFARILPNAKPLTRKHSTDAGADICAAEWKKIAPFSMEIIRTGIKIEIPDGYFPYIASGFIWPKGRSNHLIGAGVIDYSYDGEILVKYVNFTDKAVYVSEGDSLGQLVLVPVIVTSLDEVQENELFVGRGARVTEGITKQYESTATFSTDFYFEDGKEVDLT